ncbi:hypothetical protein CPB84DRAFT_1761956 [Gymnopilus junonius]|uniref:Uncharacterized protein n=1 Tax=Gymnopilus junonius TaxID=109634 RepID=A0A9P5P1D5_GYMJU|nr:hypothetical protein CPB84DRAFT_1761956 [Gymnopilus junonius]
MSPRPRGLNFKSMSVMDKDYRIPFVDGPQLSRQLTQEVQNKKDNEKRREALRDLVESWMDRLQLISVITAFFASTEASMITITAPSPGDTALSITAQVANIGILGALVFHSNAAIISFLAAFFLVGYKLKVAKVEESEAGKPDKVVVDSPTSMSIDDAERIGRGYNSEHETDPVPGIIKLASPLGPTMPIYSSNPHLVQVGPFQDQPPTHLLGRCHALCVVLTVVGFTLALLGILCFAWDRLPLSVSISSSAFMALCLFAGVYVWMQPEPAEGTSPYIYVKGD